MKQQSRPDAPQVQRTFINQATTIRKRYVFTLPSGRQLIVIYEDASGDEYPIPIK